MNKRSTEINMDNYDHHFEFPYYTLSGIRKSFAEAYADDIMRRARDNKKQEESKPPVRMGLEDIFEELAEVESKLKDISRKLPLVVSKDIGKLNNNGGY